MEMLKRRTMTNAYIRKIPDRQQFIQVLFSFYVQCTSRLIENNETRRVQQKTTKSQSLLFTQRKNSRPILLDIKIRISRNQLLQVNLFKHTP